MLRRFYDKGLNRVFWESEKGFYIIAPMGILSPLVFATRYEKEFNRAKTIYNMSFIIWMIVLTTHFDSQNGSVSKVIVWKMLGMLLGIYLCISVLCPEVVRYSKRKHGSRAEI